MVELEQRTGRFRSTRSCRQFLQVHLQQDCLSSRNCLHDTKLLSTMISHYGCMIFLIIYHLNFDIINISFFWFHTPHSFFQDRASISASFSFITTMIQQKITTNNEPLILRTLFHCHQDKIFFHFLTWARQYPIIQGKGMHHHSSPTTRAKVDVGLHFFRRSLQVLYLKDELQSSNYNCFGQMDGLLLLQV